MRPAPKLPPALDAWLQGAETTLKRSDAPAKKELLFALKLVERYSGVFVGLDVFSAPLRKDGSRGTATAYRLPNNLASLPQFALKDEALLRLLDVCASSRFAADFLLDDTALTPELLRRLAGTGRLFWRAPGGAPLAGARVSVAGTDVVGTTSPNGAFALAGLPAGTHSLEVRAIGYAPTRVAVNLARTRPASVAVTVNERVNTLESVVVQADRTKLQKDFTGFSERAKRGGFGRYITEDDMRRRSAFAVSDVLRTVPGLRVVRNGGFGYAVLGRGNCTPDVFIDGTRVLDGSGQLDQLIQPQDVGGIEVYPGGTGAPPQLTSPGGSSCGVVAVWSKRGR